MALEIESLEPEEASCGCCATTTRLLSGLVHDHDQTRTVASYSVRWTNGHLVEHGALVTLVLGAFGDAASADDRAVVQVYYGLHASGGLAFHVIDADAGPFADVAKSALRRDEVVGTPLAKNVFDVLDVIWLRDPGIAAMHDPELWTRS